MSPVFFCLLATLALNVLHTQSTEAAQEVYKHKEVGKKEESSPSGTHPPRDVGGEKRLFIIWISVWRGRYEAIYNNCIDRITLPPTRERLLKSDQGEILARSLKIARTDFC